ncbi:MAG: hypothetical protein L6R37_002055 [Teloschistes peruensis]|nr:MAG: hypothetical protein L6R37_002055 [Teloschistes peruensis]
MFILTTISDLVQISPQDLQKPSAESIEDNINAKYANKVGSQTILDFIFSSKCDIVKVVQKIGLCICVYDILAASDGLIGHGTGIVNVNVHVKLTLFYVAMIMNNAGYGPMRDKSISTTKRNGYDSVWSKSIGLISLPSLLRNVTLPPWLNAKVLTVLLSVARIPSLME